MSGPETSPTLLPGADGQARSPSEEQLGIDEELTPFGAWVESLPLHPDAEKARALANAVARIAVAVDGWSAPRAVSTRTTCAVCGASLAGKKPGAQYCSASHRVKASKARRAA